MPVIVYRKKKTVCDCNVHGFCRYNTKALDIWEDILTLYPTDVTALKFAQDSYFDIGYQAQMRDSVARVLPSWDKTIPLYGWVHLLMEM